MKRSWLKRKPCKLKRSRLKTKTIRSLLLKECDELFRQIILGERLNKCEWCGKVYRLQVAHILSKGLHPRLRYFKGNIVLLCFPCHPEKFHRNPLEAAKFIEESRGKDCIDKLKVYDVVLPKLTNVQIGLYILAFKQELKEG